MAVDEGEEAGANASARRECNGKKRERMHDDEDVEEPEPSQATLVGTQEPIPINAALLDGGILRDASELILARSLPLETYMPLHEVGTRESWEWPRCVRFPLTIAMCLKILPFQPFTV